MKFSIRDLLRSLFATPENPRQYSLVYLFLILFWAGVALALLRLFPFTEKVSIAVILLLVTAFLTAVGATVGGIFKKMRLGAAIGCSLGVLLLLFYWSLITLFDWFIDWLEPI